MILMKERSLVLLKPDAVQRGIIGDLISRFERAGLKPIGLKMVQADKDMAGRHYIDDESWLLSVGEKTKKSYESKGEKVTRTAKEIGLGVRAMLMDFLLSSPTVAICFEGHGAVDKIRQMIGSTAPSSASPGTIRGDYSLDSYKLADTSGRAVKNLVHASDSVENAKREIAVWFKDSELCPYERADEFLLYGK